MEEGRGSETRPLPHHLPVLLPAAEATVLHRLVVVLPDGELLEPVPLDPAALVGAPELRPDLRGEPVEEVEERRAISTQQSSRQGEGLAAGVGQHAGGDALGGTAPFV